MSRVDYMEVVGTNPWMGEVDNVRNRLSRAAHDCMDAGGRVKQESEPRMPKPSRDAQNDYMEVIG